MLVTAEDFKFENEKFKKKNKWHLLSQLDYKELVFLSDFNWEWTTTKLEDLKNLCVSQTLSLWIALLVLIMNSLINHF